MTARQVDIHPEALAEAEAAILWYGERSLRAPAAFIPRQHSFRNWKMQSNQLWMLQRDGQFMSRTADACLYCGSPILLFITKKQTN
jgi:hypothetical protein